MRRSELIMAINELYDALTETRVLDLIGKPEKQKGDAPRSESTIETLEALKQYAVRVHKFKPATRQLRLILNLLPLEDTARWLQLIDYTPFAARFRDNIRFAVDFLPKIVRIFEPEMLSILEGESKKENSPYKDMRVLAVTVFEPEKVFSSPLRLANVLESINHFYTACALMENESPSTLSVIACDSGSDKSFDFLGLAKVMGCVERLIGTIWDRAFFFRERQFEERLELVSKSLPVIEHINTMEKQKQIDPEMAEILRRNIFDGSNKFLQSGATIPKIEDKTEYNPRMLLSPIQKLLVAAPDESVEEVKSESKEDTKVKGESEDILHRDKGTSDTLNIGGLTPDEQEQLIKLVEKSKRAKIQEGENFNIEGEGELSVETAFEDSSDDLSS